MKRIWVVVALVVLALWCGYNRGYHRGVRVERAAWEGGEQVEFDPKEGKVVAVFQSSGPGRAVRVTTEQAGRALRYGCYYANPHAKVGVDLVAPQAVNVPDPRDTPVK